MTVLLGWITNIIQTDSICKGELIGCNGKLYEFCPSLSCDALPHAFSLPQAVAFTPGSVGDVFPVAEEISPIEEEQSPTLAAFQKLMQERVSLKRYLHCFRTSKIARVFAEKSGCSVEKAEIAGLLHDLAKELPNEENARIISASKWPVTSFELEYHSILHAVAGAILAQKDLGITDPDILAGIRGHNGRPAMSDMEKVIYIADHIDNLNKQGRNANRLLDSVSTDDAIFHMILIVNEYFVKHHQTPDIITECTMNYMLQSIGRGSDISVSPDTRSGISDEIFDKGLSLCARQSIGLRSVPNTRQLGGYPSSSGRVIRGNCLVRSARLHSLTSADARLLLDFGIDTIIDLRTEEEMLAHPDQHVSDFRFFSCPLPTIEINHFQKQVGEKFVLTQDPKEKSFYLSEYLSCLHMEDMYYEVLTAPEAVTNLKRVFDILSASQTHGVLFHCTSGKDRTGIVAALIMYLLGVSLADIRLDYYASALSTFASTEVMAQSLRKEHYRPDAIDEIRYYNGIGQNIAESTFQKIAEEFGGLDAYLTDVLDMSEAKRELLREKYLV